MPELNILNTNWRSEEATRLHDLLTNMRRLIHDRQHARIELRGGAEKSVRHLNSQYLRKLPRGNIEGEN